MLAALLDNPEANIDLFSGATSGWQFGGPLGTLERSRDDYLSIVGNEIKAAKQRQAEEEAEIAKEFDAGYQDTEPKDYFGGIVSGVKDFFMGPSIEDEIMMGQAVKDAGFTFEPMSNVEKGIGMGLSYLGPGPIGFGKGIADALAALTGSRILGTVDTPYGRMQLTESGQLQAPDFLAVESDGVWEPPRITKKRKEEKEEEKEEEEKEEKKEEEKEARSYFPLTPLERRTLTNIYGPDAYLLNEEGTGLRTLV
jgi:hypothetical protein